MFAMLARVVPHIMRAAVSWDFGDTTTLLPSILVSTLSVNSSLSSPSLPFAVRMLSASAMVTPAGTSTGYLPTRDIAFSPLEDAAENFAADIGSAGLDIAHHAARRGEDGNTKTGIDARQLLDLGVDAAARTGHAADLFDHRLAFAVFQLN